MEQLFKVSFNVPYSAPHQNLAFYQRQSGWACRLSVCAAAQLPAVACPCLHEPGFCVLLCSGWASFHVEHVVHSSCSKCWRGEFGPCAACWSSGWKCTEQNKEKKHTPHVRLIALKKKNIISWSLFIFLCQISRGSFACVPLKVISPSAWRAAPTVI